MTSRLARTHHRGAVARSTRSRWRGDGFGLVLICAALALACAEPAPEPSVSLESPEDIRTVKAADSPDPDARYVAVLVPLQAVDVTAKEAGDLTAVHVRPGDIVAAADVIAELDLGPIGEALTIARAELQSLRALLEQRDVDIAAAERALEIERDMAARGIGAQKHEEEARFALERARKARQGAAAAVDEQRARIAQLQRRGRESAIKAPFAGAVALRYRDPGTAVSTGSAIVRLIRVDALWARFAVPPTDIVHLAVDDSVDVEVPPLSVTLPAVVRHVSPELDPAAQMVFVDAWLEVPRSLQGSLRAGLPAWVRRSAATANSEGDSPTSNNDSAAEAPAVKRPGDNPDARDPDAQSRAPQASKR